MILSWWLWVWYWELCGGWKLYYKVFAMWRMKQLLLARDAALWKEQVNGVLTAAAGLHFRRSLQICLRDSC